MDLCISSGNTLMNVSEMHREYIRSYTGTTSEIHWKYIFEILRFSCAVRGFVASKKEVSTDAALVAAIRRCVVPHEVGDRPVKNHRCPGWFDSTRQEQCQPDPQQPRCGPVPIHHLQVHCRRHFPEGRSPMRWPRTLGRAEDSGLDHREHRST